MQEKRQRIKPQVLNKKQSINTYSLFDHTKFQWMATIKNQTIEQKLLKEIVVKYNALIWSQELNDQKLQLITFIGFTNVRKIDSSVNARFNQAMQQLMIIFQQKKQFPSKVNFGKLMAFNIYGMYQRKCQDECELCATQIKDENQVLNCCGKCICQKCKVYPKNNICCFCRQAQLQIFVLSRG